MRPRSPIASDRVLEVRRRLDHWRRRHRPPTPIPEELWRSAVDLAREAGAYGTSRALRLNYRSLKRRLEASAGRRTSDAACATAFVELVPVAGPSGVSECLVELENGSGTKLKIQLKGARAPEVVSLATALWRGER